MFNCIFSKALPNVGSFTNAALGAPLQHRKPTSLSLEFARIPRRFAQRCSSSLDCAVLPRTTAIKSAAAPTSLADHSRWAIPIPSTSKPVAHWLGFARQRESNRSPVGNGLLSGPLQARSHSSSVHNRAPDSAHLVLASSRVRPVVLGRAGSFGKGSLSISKLPSSTL